MWLKKAGTPIPTDSMCTDGSRTGRRPTWYGTMARRRRMLRPSLPTWRSPSWLRRRHPVPRTTYAVGTTGREKPSTRSRPPGHTSQGAAPAADRSSARPAPRSEGECPSGGNPGRSDPKAWSTRSPRREGARTHPASMSNGGSRRGAHQPSCGTGRSEEMTNLLVASLSARSCPSTSEACSKTSAVPTTLSAPSDRRRLPRHGHCRWCRPRLVGRRTCPIRDHGMADVLRALDAETGEEAPAGRAMAPVVRWWRPRASTDG